MTIGEAAKNLGVPVARVRKLCRMHDDDPATGLAYEWTSGAAPRTNRMGQLLRGHRRPLVAAVTEMRERMAALAATPGAPPGEEQS